MTEARNKERAATFFRAFWAEDMVAVDAHLAPAATFLLMPSISEERVKDARDALGGIVTTMFSRFSTDDPLRCEITSLIAEGDEVAMEYSAQATTVDGERYHNHYSAHLTFDANGRITVLRTYADTVYLMTKLMGARMEA
jgi:ketosteroid isomerase-like protein